MIDIKKISGQVTRTNTILNHVISSLRDLHKMMGESPDDMDKLYSLDIGFKGDFDEMKLKLDELEEIINNL